MRSQIHIQLRKCSRYWVHLAVHAYISKSMQKTLLLTMSLSLWFTEKGLKAKINFCFIYSSNAPQHAILIKVISIMKSKRPGTWLTFIQCTSLIVNPTLKKREKRHWHKHCDNRCNNTVGIKMSNLNVQFDSFTQHATLNMTDMWYTFLSSIRV